MFLFDGQAERFNKNMKRFLWLNVVILILILMTGNRLYSGDSLLPKEIKEEIANRYKGWRIFELKDLCEWDQKIWKEDHGEAHPGIASGKYDNSGKTLYAVAIIGEENKKQVHKLLMFKEVSPKNYSISVIEEELWNDCVIYKGKPGKYSYHFSQEEAEKDTDLWNGTEKRVMKITTDVLIVELIESQASLYYWKDGKFHELITSI